MNQIYLTEPQQRYLRASLISFEKALRLADHLIDAGDEIGILYYRKLHLDPNKRKLAQYKILQALHELTDLVKQLGLESVEENTNRIILSEMSVSWSDLVDCHSDRMKGYGNMDAAAAAKIDQAVDHLERAAFELNNLMSFDSPRDIPNEEKKSDMTENKLTSSITKTLEIQVTIETDKDIKTFIEEQGWDEPEGLRIILGAGLGYLRGKPFLGYVEETGLFQDPKQLVILLAKAEASLASMRFRMFELQQMNNHWELSNGAVFQENIGLKNLTNRHIEEINNLHSKVSFLQAELTNLRSQQTEKEIPQQGVAHEYHLSKWHKWLKNLFK